MYTAIETKRVNDHGKHYLCTPLLICYPFVFHHTMHPFLFFRPLTQFFSFLLSLSFLFFFQRMHCTTIFFLFFIFKKHLSPTLNISIYKDINAFHLKFKYYWVKCLPKKLSSESLLFINMHCVFLLVT